MTNSTFSGDGIENSHSLTSGYTVTTTLKNTILANGASCSGSGFSDGGYNLESANTCGLGSTSLKNTNPLLGALGNYGGGTMTMPLLPGSPAINAGNNATCESTDQRGVARQQQGTCDIGAFESRGFSVALTGGNNQTAAVNATFAAPLALSVTSAYGEPVDGGSIVFTAPSSGASTNPAVITATIVADGAVSQSVTANGTAGAYSVSANARGGASAATFNLTNINASDLTATKSNNVSGSGTFGSSFNWTIRVANGGTQAAAFASGQTITIRAVYGGDTDCGASSGTLTQNVGGLKYYFPWASKTTP